MKYRTVYLSSTIAIISILAYAIYAGQDRGILPLPDEMNTSIKGASMEPNIGIETTNRQAVAAILNDILANEYVLYTQTLNYHWNVKGPHFHDLHAMFREQYEQQLQRADDVAERVRSLGERAFGTLQEFSQRATIKEEPGVVPSAHIMIQNLLNGHETIIRLIRKDLQKVADQYGDLGTNNFLTDLMEKHEKTAWMLRATLQK